MRETIKKLKILYRLRALLLTKIINVFALNRQNRFPRLCFWDFHPIFGLGRSADRIKLNVVRLVSSCVHFVSNQQKFLPQIHMTTMRKHLGRFVWTTEYYSLVAMQISALFANDKTKLRRSSRLTERNELLFRYCIETISWLCILKDSYLYRYSLLPTSMLRKLESIASK